MVCAGRGPAVRALGAGGAGVPQVPPHTPRRRVARPPPPGHPPPTHTLAAASPKGLLCGKRLPGRAPPFAAGTGLCGAVPAGTRRARGAVRGDCR